MLPSSLAIGLAAHFIPATVIPNGDLERAMSEPLARGRDEVIYLACSHPRLRLLAPNSDGRLPITRAEPDRNRGIVWPDVEAWALVDAPPAVRRSVAEWAIIDDALATEEGLPPNPKRNDSDPDGPNASRQELMGWVLDRHWDSDAKRNQHRGDVEGGIVSMRLEYVGSTVGSALRRYSGAHHRVAPILGHLLTYEPHRWLYVLPGTLQVLFTDEAGYEGIAPSLAEAVAEYNIDRATLIHAAEQMLIAWLDPPYNTSNTRRRRFPATAAADRLRSLGVKSAAIQIFGLPTKVRISGAYGEWSRETPAAWFDLETGHQTSPPLAD